jgi:hypothetical protein
VVADHQGFGQLQGRVAAGVLVSAPVPGALLAWPASGIGTNLFIERRVAVLAVAFVSRPPPANYTMSPSSLRHGPLPEQDSNLQSGS